MARLQLLGRQMKSSWNDRRLGVEFVPMPHVHHHQGLTRVQLALELLWRDPGDAEPSQEALSADILPYDVGAKRRAQKRADPAPHRLHIGRRHLELVAEQPSEADE